jgi:hypothetical protein
MTESTCIELPLVIYQAQKMWSQIKFHLNLVRAGLLFLTAKKSSWPVTGLRNRGPLKDLNDSKLIVYESKWFPWSSEFNFIPFKIFRGPLFYKRVTGQELFFCCFLQQTGSNDMRWIRQGSYFKRSYPYQKRVFLENRTICLLHRVKIALENVSLIYG